MAKPRQLGTVARNLLRLRNELGVGQTELCRRAGIARSTLTTIERGTAPSPTIDTVAKLAAGLGVPVTALTEERSAGRAAEAIEALLASSYAGQLTPPLQPDERAWLAQLDLAWFVGPSPKPQALFLLVLARRASRSG